MSEPNRADFTAVLKAILDDWALVDEGPELDYFIGVSESRTTLEGFRPTKDLVRLMEGLGLIADSDKRPLEERAITYWEKAAGEDWKAITDLYPLVYFFEVTEKGERLLSDSQGGAPAGARAAGDYYYDDATGYEIYRPEEDVEGDKDDEA